MNKFRNILITLVLALTIGSVAYATSFTVGVEKSNAKPVALVDEDGISINSSNPLSISASSSAVSTIFDNRKVVASAGTAEPLAGSATPFTRCTVQAESDNTGDVVIGASTVVASSATRRGISLVSGSAYTFTSPFDLASIYIDSEVTGEGVTYFCQN